MAALRGKIIVLTESLHHRVFGHGMSEEMRGFLGNLSWSVGAGILAAAIMFSVNIFAGRFLGPAEFGKYNYIISLATSLMFFFLLGNNQSGIRYASDKKYKKKQHQIFGTVLLLTFVQAILVFFVFFVFQDVIDKKINLGISVVYLVLLFGFILSLKELFDAFIRAFGLFRLQGIVRVGDAIFVFITFFLFFFLFHDRISSVHYIVAMISGALFSVAVFAYLLRKKFEWFEREDVSTILHYNKFLILGTFAGAVMSLEKVFIGKYIGIESLGVYSAYYASSQLIMSNLGILFMNIFWPTVIRNKNNLRPILDKLNRIFFRFFPIWIGINFLGIFFFMFLYGKEYPIYLSFLILFSVSSLLNIFFFVYMSIMNIDRVSVSVIINMIVYGLLISSIFLFKSIPAYLVVQIVVYSIAIVYVRKNLSNNLIAETI